MNVQVIGWARDSEDQFGKEQKELFYVVIDGKEKALSKSAFLQTIKTILPERDAEDLPTPLLDRIENGSRV